MEYDEPSMSDVLVFLATISKASIDPPPERCRTGSGGVRTIIVRGGELQAYERRAAISF
jgi:hypothetical protein